MESNGSMNIRGNAIMSWRSGIRSWLVVLLLMGAMTFSLVDRFALSLMVDPIKEHYHLSDSGIGLINGIAFGLFYSVMGLPLGFLADRWSRKGTIILGVGVWSAATAMCGLSSNVAQFAVSRTLVGAGEASLAPAGYSIIYDRFTKSALSRAISVFLFGSVIGSGLALLVGGAVYSYFTMAGDSFPFMTGLEPWQKTFIALALPGIPCIILLSLLRDTTPKTDVSADVEVKRDYSEILNNLHKYILISLGMALMAVASYAFLSWIPTIISREYGWLPNRIGSEYGVLLMFVSPPGLLLGGWLSDTLVARGYNNAHALVALLSASIALPLSLGIPLATSPSFLLVIVGLIHFAICLAAGSTPAYIQIITPRHARSQVSAAYILILNALGLGVGPTLIGWLSSLSANDPQALRAAVSAVVIPSLALAVFLLAVLAWRERQPQPPAIGEP
jgi:MFS family permease